jgi:hypothetical protein
VPSSGEAVKPRVVDVLLEGVALDFVDIDAGQLAGHEFGQVQAFLLLELALVDRLDIGRHLQARNADAGQGRVADHFDGRRLDDPVGAESRGEAALRARASRRRCGRWVMGCFFMLFY